jgi:hypothetical protein
VKTTPVERISHFRATKGDVRYRGNRAYYAVEVDYIQMPVVEAFRFSSLRGIGLFIARGNLDGSLCGCR